MRWIYKLPLRFRSLFRKSRVEQDLSDELRFHLEKLTEEKLARGMSREEARYAALRELGGVEQIKEECRDMRRMNYIENFLQDVRYGLRQSRRSPGFTAVAVLTLALGIGANTAIFSIVSGVLLRKPPVRDPDRVMMVLSVSKKEGWGNAPEHPASVPDFLDWRQQCRVCEEMAAFEPWQNLHLTGQAEPVQVTGTAVSANYFQLLGVPAALGRTLVAGEDQPGHERVAILSYELWENHFGHDARVLGKTVQLDGQPHTIVGVMPKNFNLGILDSQVWTPLALTPAQDGSDQRSTRSIYVLARVKPGITAKMAAAETATIAAHLEQAYPKADKDLTTAVMSLQEFQIEDTHVRPALMVLMGIVGFVLLIACANIAGLLLARGAARQHEFAIRASLGAGRVRLLRQLLSEGILIAFVGGSLGLLIALWGTNLLRAALDFNPTVSNWQFGIDPRVLLFTLGISLFSVFLFGLAPGLEASRTDLQMALKEGSRTGTVGAAGTRMRRVFVVSEIALALVLLIGAGLMIEFIVEEFTTYPGFNARQLLAADIALPTRKYSNPTDQASFFKQVTEQARNLPGVLSATAAASLPLTAQAGYVSFTLAGQSPTEGSAKPRARSYTIGPDYLRTMGIPLLKGRAFTEADNQTAPYVILVNEAFARQFFPDRDAIGQHLTIEADTPEGSQWQEIVGVVGNVKDYSGQIGFVPQIYQCYLQSPSAAMTLVVRTQSDPNGLAPALRRAVWSVDKDQPIGGVMTMTRLVDATGAAGDRLMAELLGIFAGVALVLAAIGIYGTMAFSVSQRTHEIGMRMALGADKRDVLKLVLGEGARLTTVGMLGGLVVSLVLPRLLSGAFQGFYPHTTRVFVGVSSLVAAVALLASYIPARRAAKVDPMVALRYE